MTIAVPQDILDALTDVGMPRLPPVRLPGETVQAGGHVIPVLRCGCLIVGSGAAGLRAAVELKRRGDDITVISQSAFGGTSACSGSDKQTLHIANTADRGDNYFAMAKAIRAGGAMDEDSAYVEAVGSSRAMASLQYLGLPLPQNVLGATLRYQTDHDEAGRATSCGPRTSRLMVKVLAEEALRLGVPVYNHTTAVKILTEDGKVCGVLAMRAPEVDEGNPLGLVLIQCGVLLLAAGGPGELYRDSVYPNSCFGSLGLALDAGLELTNLTESQFGIARGVKVSRGNLSGTYVQAMPHIYSVDAQGREHHFLGEYYRTTQEMASNIFRKGYQWPFHSTRMLDFGSSLVDLAIYREGEAGRRVFMDFNRNPLPVPGDQPFSLERLDDDVRRYLATAGADQTLPIARLKHMNPLSIELYRRYKIDITTEPLESAVNNQHMNGGIAVDVWGRSNIGNCYAVGEAAGTHGVTRPGGAALNAGQVFGTRAAEHIAASGAAKAPPAGAIKKVLEAGLRAIKAVLQPDSPLAVKAVRADVQKRMSERAGILCTADGVRQALQEAQTLNERISRQGLSHGRAAEALRALQWQQMALASEAVLTALDHYIGMGGGSRGARAICDSKGQSLPQTRNGSLEDYRFRREREEDRAVQIVIKREDDGFKIATRPNRAFDENAHSFFERDWPDWLTGEFTVLAFKNHNVAAIGEAMIELAPQANGDYRRGFAGDTFNTLWHMAQLMKGEGRGRFITRIGQDSISESFAADLAASSIDTAGVSRDPARTMGLYLIELKNAERSFHYWRGQSAAKLLAADVDFLAASLEDCGLIHLSGITLAILSEDDRGKLFAALDACRKKGALVFLDPNIRPRLWNSADEIRGTLSRMLPLTDIALPSFDDEKTHWGDATPQDTIKRMIGCGVCEVVVKDGAGAVVFADENHAGSRSTPPVSRLVDTTGAGDAFNAGYLVARLNGIAPDEAVTQGQRLAALVIGHYGARAPAEAVRAL